MLAIFRTWSISRGLVRTSSLLITAAERLYYTTHERADTTDWLAEELGPQDPTATVLDFGGGDGNASLGLRSRIGGRYVVADVSAVTLGRIPPDPGVAPVLIAPFPEVPFADESLAGVVLVDVLHHVQDHRETLAELVRCLRPGGALAIIEFEPRHVATRIFGLFASMGGRRCQFRVSGELATMVQSLGLSVTVTTLDGLRYGLVGRR